MKKTILLDGHVHIYPQFNLNNAIKSSMANFEKLQRKCADENTVRFWLLTERSDCSFFQDIINKPANGCYFAKTNEETAVAVHNSAAKEILFYLLAGRQLVSAENLEICALASDYFIKDKQLSAADVVKEVNSAGGIAAVNWAPGKWFGERGTIVQKLFEDFSPNELFISDTTMRPTFWRTPKLMQQAMDKGFRVISGSDPLPFAGEEKMIAKYGCCFTGDFDETAPATSLKNAVLAASKLNSCGRRSGFFSFAKRQTKIMLDKK